jgi:hypothetical protein
MTATEELIADMKLWSCSPRVPLKAQLVMLEAIGRLSSPPEAAAGIPMTKEWIEEAKCGNCGGVGWRAIQVEAGVFEQDQCQWCFEQWQALEQSSEGKS